MEAIIKYEKDIKEEKRSNHKEAYGKLLTWRKENGRLSANLVTLKPGGELIPHTHEVLEVFYIIEGQGSALVNGERKPVNNGTIIIAPPGSEHGLVNIGDGDLKLFAVFSPGVE